MKIQAEIVRDSISPEGKRLTTFKLVFPRFILPEFNTHRMFSRNASSSRAIPVAKQIEMVKYTPFIPLAFNKNAKGMQGAEVLSREDQSIAEIEWLKARDFAVAQAEVFLQMGVAKQYSNRILEPFTWTTVICTATEYANFFALRYHSMAQPEICELAKQMWEAYSSNTPDKLSEGEWHLPFIGIGDKNDVYLSTEHDYETTLLKMSVARCARVSYLTHEGKKPTIEEDLALYLRLVGSAPIHASPAEHQAKVPRMLQTYVISNLKGWIQYRKMLPFENIEKFEGPSES